VRIILAFFESTIARTGDDPIIRRALGLTRSILRDHDYHRLAVADVVDEAADARSFVLEIPPALEAAFAYAAGQFCTFRATIGGEPVVRCYSMSSSPDTGDPFTVTVKRVAGGRMSNWMNDALAPGDTIEVMPPAGRFVLRAAEVPIVAFAGGSGITPILSITKTALVRTTREIALVYANRGPGSVIFADALERLRAASGGRLSVHHHLDSERGFLDAAACAALVGDRTQADFYVCGPGPYMEVAQAGLERRGVARSQLFIERFELPGGEPAATETSATESIVIRLAGRKHAVAYQPGDTILDAARRAGLKPPFACQQGSCGTCMARLVDGKATMRANDALDADEVEQGWVLTCQAIPTSREVVVDYDG
jgi:ferredoxin-NADP reductase